MLSQVEGKKVNLPFYDSQYIISVRKAGMKVLFTSKYGIKIEYNGNHMFSIEMPKSYHGCTGGERLKLLFMVFALNYNEWFICILHFESCRRFGWQS